MKFEIYEAENGYYYWRLKPTDLLREGPYKTIEEANEGIMKFKQQLSLGIKRGDQQ